MHKRASWLAAFALAIAAAGCAGSDGAQGPQGAPGTPGAGTPGVPGEPGPGAMAVETCVLCHGAGKFGDVAATHAAPLPGLYDVTVDEIVWGTTTTLQVAFRVMDGGSAVTNLPAKSVAVNLSVLAAAPGGGGVQDWVPLVKSSGRATTENTGALVNLGGGDYVYSFATNVTADANYVTTDTRTNRLGLQISPPTDSSRKIIPATAWVKAANVTVDFLLADGYSAVAPPTLPARDIVATDACNTCHERLGVNLTSSTALGFHNGARYDTKYCVTCHNPSRGAGRTNLASEGGVIDPAGLGTSQYVVDGEILGDFAVLVHKIHKGHNLTKQNYEYAGVAFNHVTYPQEVNVCGKCHQGPDAANGANVPSRKACGACHDNVNFATGAGHPSPGGVRTNDNSCAGCHDAAAIAGYHNTGHKSALNPIATAADGTVLDEFVYSIRTVTVDGTGRAVVTFQITKDGASFDPFAVDTARFSGTQVPAFLVAYALPQDDVAAPADYNNQGNAAAQPASVSINATNFPPSARVDNGDGSYTVTLPAANAFPAGSVLRAIGLQGYYSLIDIDPDPAVTTSSGRYARSVVKAVQGDAARRSAVNMNKCLSCHEALRLHGGNRVDDPQICVMCHNPNLTSSGRGADPAKATAAMAMFGVTTPLDLPEAPQNLKDMVHGIHGAAVRSEGFAFVRDFVPRSVTGYDFGDVTYPARIFNCQMCHDAGTYGAELPSGVLMTNLRTTTGDGETRADVAAARTAVPNGTDHVVNATAAACSGCHDDALQKAHMDQNGAGFDTRDGVLRSR